MAAIACLAFAMYRQDYLMRLIQQLAEFLARIAGLNRKGDHDKALATAAQAWDQLLDAPRDVIAAADSATLATLLREPAKIRAAAELCHEEGRALEGKGDPIHAQLRYRRALELVLEARARDPRDEDEAAILELSRLAPVDTLDPRYRSGE
jgi:tetratricopeptide (TPR) repeat protein